MIDELTLKGFKSFVSENLELARLTLLTGLNSSGKSSVIQAIRMLQKAANVQEMLLEGYGDWSELQNRFTVEFELSAKLNARMANISITKENGNAKNGDSQKMERSIEPPGSAYPELVYIAADRYGSTSTVPLYIGDNYSLGSRGENVFKCIEHFENEEIPQGVQHEDSQGLTLGYNLEAWLGVISPETKLVTHLQKKIDTSYATYNGHRAKNVGFGLSYTLPVITALLLASINRDSVVAIENPEAHLHPRGQTEIARLISTYLPLMLGIKFMNCGFTGQR